MMVQGDPKLPGDSGKVPFLNEVVGRLIHAVKSSLHLMKKLS
jgi:hypothetical protein